MRIVILLLLIPLAGCEHIGLVQRYQHQATVKCEEHHTPEQCKPLLFPSCPDHDGCAGGVR